MDAQPPIDIYARVSRASDDRQRSVQGQVADCRVRLDELGLPLGDVHVDNSLSAWNPRVRRTEWHELMRRLESGIAGGVVVFDLARFSRRPIEGERLIEAAERGLLVLDSEGAYDLTTANGKKQFRDQLATAAYESDRLSTRVKRGKRAKALAGEPNVSHRPFGFEPDGVTVRESEAEVLREMTARFLAGEGQDHLWRDLNTRGIPTSTDGQWTRRTLRQVLERPRNAGIVDYRGEHVARLPGDEPIIDPADWERVVATFAARRRGRPPSDVYLCSGIAVCGFCRTRLYCRPRTGMRPYPDGSVRRQYWCQPGHGGCQRVCIDQRGLDEHALKLTVMVLSDERHAAALEAAAAERATLASQLDATIADLEHLALELAGRLGRNEITLARYDAATKPLDTRLAKLRVDRDALPEEPGPIDVKASRAEWERRLKAASTPERRKLLRMALRGRALLVGPADRTNRTDVTGRVRVEEP